MAQKHKSEEPTPPELKKNKKRKINDIESEDLFEKWLNGEVDFLEGILAPILPTKKPCLEQFRFRNKSFSYPPDIVPFLISIIFTSFSIS